MLALIRAINTIDPAPQTLNLTTFFILSSYLSPYPQTNTMAPSQIEETSVSQQFYPPVKTIVSAESSFTSLPIHPKDEPFALHGEYLADPHPNKVNLGIGVYRTEDGRPWPLNVVEEVERQLHQGRDDARHEYLTIQGDLQFLSLARDLVFGFQEPDSTQQREDKNRTVSVQTVSGTGANRLGAEFLARSLKPDSVWIPEPTWGNHHAIWELVQVDTKTYPYYDVDGKCFDYERTALLLKTQAKKGDVVILHACAHNPTGADPTKEQWMKLAIICQTNGLIPFFDLAYQGFASGNLEEDAWAVRHFLHASPQLEFCVAQSFSKNFGLYGQRTGVLHVVTKPGSETVPQAVLSNINLLARSEYGMAPRGGSDIVKTVLGSKELREKWQGDLKHMSGRIQAMRRTLYDELVRLGTPGTWEHILTQVSYYPE